MKTELYQFYQNITRQAKTRKIFAEINEELMSYRDLAFLIRKTITLFKNCSLSTGNKIIIITNFNKAALILFVSCLLEGLCPILLDPSTKPAKLKQLINLTKAHALFIDETYESNHELSNTILVPIAISKKTPFSFIKKKLLRFCFPDLLHSLAPTEPSCQAQSDDLAFIAFTSGSTASPKGVMITYRNLFSHLNTLKKVFGYDQKTILFNNLPLFHNDGLVQGPLIVLYAGASLIRPEKFTLQNMDFLLNKIIAKKISHFISTPAILALINRYTTHNDFFNTPYFKTVISTAAPLNKDLWQKIETRFRVKVCNVYGLTETVAGGLFCGPNPEQFLHGTVGMPIDMTIKIVDANNTLIENEHVGELLVQGDNVSPGYFGNQVATDAVFKSNWFYTGDLARKNKQGFVEIVGRKKEVILTKGVIVCPEEIGEILKYYPNLNDVIVFGLDDPIWDEVIVAVIEAESILDDQLIFQYCRENLELEKIPNHIIFTHKILRSPSGKPLLLELKEFAKREINKIVKHSQVLSEAQVINVAAKVFNLSNTTLTLQSTPYHIPAWDSLGHIRLIEAIESAFHVHFDLRDIMNITSLENLYERVKAYHGIQ